MRNFKRYIPIILLIMHCVLICFFSAQDKESSTTVSQGIVETVVEVTPNVETLTKPQMNKADFVVRKSAHIALYFVLGVYAYLSAGCVKIKHKALIAVLFCLLFATFDELNQELLSGRAGEFTDVLLDFISSCLGAFVTLLSIKKIKREKYEKF